MCGIDTSLNKNQAHRDVFSPQTCLSNAIINFRVSKFYPFPSTFFAITLESGPNVSYKDHSNDNLYGGVHVSELLSLIFSICPASNWRHKIKP